MECGVSNSAMIVPNSFASEVGILVIIDTTMTAMMNTKDDGSNDNML
eukprot:CAMPEP_0170782788 /NCGR_PEP_ID=MMETSP0733-20121128/15110_1 /TAXON_ID=186038 /ORGANISM="Fragilariopsis kerguelensis, Strain L26-C5" /LENGTH=46 /DNA_ID= /DNA_START= /DNA_END= /DNA_ORIENTATION=